MKIGIIGTGSVGCACAMAAVNRGSAREIVLVNRTRKTAEAVATDIRCGTPLCPKVEIVDGDYDALAGAAVVMITSGVNEKTDLSIYVQEDVTANEASGPRPPGIKPAFRDLLLRAAAMAAPFAAASWRRMFTTPRKTLTITGEIT
jgi:ornithine cyclodeaminase/alanine dehydrogenase-like protein (mu-crystallin family)